MSFEQDEKREINPEESQESTIFSDPAHFREENEERKSTAKKSAVIKITAVLLAVGIAVGGFFVIRNFIPKPTDENQKEEILITSVATQDVEKISVKNETAQYTLFSTLEDGDEGSEYVWALEGIDAQLTSSSLIENLAETVCELKASAIVTDAQGDFGFDNPGITVDVTVREGAGDFTVTIGKTAPSNFGAYCKVTGDDSIYVISSADFEDLLAEPIDFATTTGYTGVKETSENTTCFTNGNITDFDYISLSGAKYEKPLRIELQKDTAINSYFAYKITSPTNRIGGDTAIGELITCFASGVASSGAYSFSSGADELKAYGLDNPDCVATISLKGKLHTFKFSVVDDLFCAMICDGSPLIHKVALSTLSIAGYATEDYYSGSIILETLSGLDKMTVETPQGDTYEFILKYTAADDENGVEQSYQAFYNQKELDIANFKRYYSNLIGLAPISYESAELDDISATITLGHTDKNIDDVVLTFKKYSAGRYQVELDGTPMGLITSTEFNSLMEDTVKAANDQTVTANN